MKILVIDTENSIQPKDKSPFGPSAKDPNNDIYTFIWGHTPDSVNIKHCENGFNRELPKELAQAISESDIIVGHNLGHDLEYIWRNKTMSTFILRGGKLWCTQHTEYLLTGQQHKNSALEELEEKYLGAKVKLSRISRLFKAGYGADKIVSARHRCRRLFALYEQYCVNDGTSTLHIFKKQFIRAKREGMLNVIELGNDYLKVIMQMETEGIHINIEKAKSLQHEYNIKYITAMQSAQSILKSVWKDSRLPEFNINSPDHKSAALFGGLIKCVVKKKVGDYKNGNPHYKNVIEDVWVEGLGISTDYTTETKKKGVYSVNDDVIQKIAANTTTKSIKDYVQAQQETALYQKAANTDIAGFLEYSVNGKLYPHFNMSSTATSRLSSSKPNMQNKSVRTSLGREIHELMEAPDGFYYVAFDFSQLEKWLQAWVSKDPTLTKRLLEGQCLHCIALSRVLGVSYEEAYQKAKVEKIPEWDALRTNAKITSFQMDYGAMAQSIANDTGIPLEDVEKIVEVDKSEYPVKHQFFEQTVPLQIQTTAKLSLSCDVPRKMRYKNGKLSENYENNFELLPIYGNNKQNIRYNKDERRRVGYYIDPLGAKYAFYDNGYETKNGIKRMFSRTQPKNYPNQGGGSKVQAATSCELIPLLLRKGDIVKMILEIHDSKVFYIKKGMIEPVVKYIVGLITDIPRIYKQRFNVDMPFRIPVEVKYGENAGNLKEFKL